MKNKDNTRLTSKFECKHCNRLFLKTNVRKTHENECEGSNDRNDRFATGDKVRASLTAHTFMEAYPEEDITTPLETGTMYTVISLPSNTEDGVRIRKTGTTRTFTVPHHFLSHV